MTAKEQQYFKALRALPYVSNPLARARLLRLLSCAPEVAAPIAEQQHQRGNETNPSLELQVDAPSFGRAEPRSRSDLRRISTIRPKYQDAFQFERLNTWELAVYKHGHHDDTTQQIDLIVTKLESDPRRRGFDYQMV